MLYWLRITVAAVVSSVERVLVRAMVLLLALVMVGIVLLLGASLLAWPVAAGREGRIDRRWSASLDPLSSLPDRLLPHAATPSALLIESLAADLGIEVAPAQAEERARPTPRALVAWAAAMEDFEAFGGELVRTAGSLPVPALAVERFLQENLGTIAQLADAAGHGIPPRWEVDLSQGRDGARPSVDGLRDIQRVLAAEIVVRWHSNDHDSALATLDAAWRLNRGAFERPEMASFLSAQESLDELLAILRGMDPPPQGWLDRLVGLGLDRRYLQLLQVRSWHNMRAIARGDSVQTVDGITAWLRGPVARPFRRYAATGHSEAILWAVENIPERSMIGFERGSVDAEMREKIPRWNRLARSELRGVASGWQRTQRAVAGLELGEFILAARELDRAADRQLLDDLAGSRPSRVRGMAWNIAVEADHLTVELDGEPYPRPDPGYVALPLRATVILSAPPLAQDGGNVTS